MTSSASTRIDRCRLCGSTELRPVLDLGEMTLTGFFPRAGERVSTAPLEVVRCAGDDACHLVQLRHSAPATEMFGGRYGYRSALNRSMVEHLRSKAASLLARHPLAAGDVVLDIGSNDGTSLGFYPASARRVGIDPTAARFAEHYPTGVHVVPEFFSAEAFLRASGGARAAIVSSIAMFYDLEAPLEFAREVREILAPGGLWHFEQSYLPRMLDTGSYDTICHEHLEYYAYAQIRWMLRRLGGFKVVEVSQNEVNGGSFAVTVQRGDGAFEEAPEVHELADREAALGLDGPAPYDRFVERARSQREELIGIVNRMVAGGATVAGLGASTKGNVLLQYCGLGPGLLSCVAEVNPDKFGCFTPGTNVPIVSEGEAEARRPDVYLVLPWHFRDGIRARSRQVFSRGGRLLFPLPRVELVDS